MRGPASAVFALLKHASGFQFPTHECADTHALMPLSRTQEARAGLVTALDSPARLGRDPASRFCVLAKHRSGIQFPLSATT